MLEGSVWLMMMIGLTDVRRNGSGARGMTDVVCRVAWRDELWVCVWDIAECGMCCWLDELFDDAFSSNVQKFARVYTFFHVYNVERVG